MPLFLALALMPLVIVRAADTQMLSVSAMPAAPALSVPLDGPVSDPVYDDLEYFRARGLWSGSLGTLPLSRAECVRAIEAIREARSRADASGADGARWRRLESFAGSWGDADLPSASSGDAVASGSELRFARFELGAGVQTWFVASDLDSLADLDRRQRREQFVLVTADAALGPHLYAQFRVTEDYMRQTPYRGNRGWADNLPSGFRRAFTNATARNDRALLGYGWNWGDVRIGREDRHWGVGRHGTLFLSESPFPLDGLSLRVRTRHFSAVSLFAQLRRGGRNMRDVTLGGDTLAAADPRGNVDAWMAAHRFEVRPWPALRLGLYEAVAYGGRGIDLAYLNPAALLAAITQDLDNRAKVDDKKVLGFDLSVDLPPATLYGEFLVNRVVALDSATRGDSTQISSYAQLAGLQWADPAGWKGANLRVEYAHLDPEVYFHHDGDPGRALLHQGELIGHWLGPNADDFLLSFGPPPRERLGEVKLAYEQTRWGVIDGRRGTDLGFAGLVRKQKHWITGRKEIERIYSVDWLRPGLIAPFGTRLDGGLRVARVDRGGARHPEGWQAEARLTWRGSITRREPAWP